MPRRVLQGEVISNLNDKTVTVRVVRRFAHPLYKKTVQRSMKVTAHDPENRCNKGDAVEVIETKPISKTKKWQVVYKDTKKEVKASSGSK